jgi:hypothetical protein
MVEVGGCCAMELYIVVARAKLATVGSAGYSKKPVYWRLLRLKSSSRFGRGCCKVLRKRVAAGGARAWVVAAARRAD